MLVCWMKSQDLTGETARQESSLSMVNSGSAGPPQLFIGECWRVNPRLLASLQAWCFCPAANTGDGGGTEALQDIQGVQNLMSSVSSAGSDSVTHTLANSDIPLPTCASRPWRA